MTSLACLTDAPALSPIKYFSIVARSSKSNRREIERESARGSLSRDSRARRSSDYAISQCRRCVAPRAKFRQQNSLLLIFLLLLPCSLEEFARDALQGGHRECAPRTRDPKSREERSMYPRALNIEISTPLVWKCRYCALIAQRVVFVKFYDIL